jgi:hypothetical protein
MKLKVFFILFLFVAFSQWLYAYPPAVGIVGKAKTCLSCHISNGPWKDDGKTVIDILDKRSKESLKQPDGSFMIKVKRGEKKMVLTVIGRSKEDKETPYRNAWLYVDPETIKSSTLSKFAPGWDVNLPMSCRIVGDKLDRFENAIITVLPMTIKPTDAARDAELQLQVMFTKGESVKGKPKEGIISNYFERKVKLMVSD